MFVVYMMLNIMTGLVYIGYTRDMDTRIKKHKRHNTTPYLYDDIMKYGKDKFYSEKLIEYLTEDEALYWESRCILELDTLYPNGYNLGVKVPYKPLIHEQYQDIKLVDMLHEPENCKIERRNISLSETDDTEEPLQLVWF